MKKGRKTIVVKRGMAVLLSTAMILQNLIALNASESGGEILYGLDTEYETRMQLQAADENGEPIPSDDINDALLPIETVEESTEEDRTIGEDLSLLGLIVDDSALSGEDLPEVLGLKGSDEDVLETEPLSFYDETESMTEDVSGEILPDGNIESTTEDDSLSAARLQDGTYLTELSDWDYSIREEYIFLNAYLAYYTEFAIPSTFELDGKSYKTVLDFSWYDGGFRNSIVKDRIKRVVLPEEGLYIDQSSLFYGCTGLKEVLNFDKILPYEDRTVYWAESETSLYETFRGCEALEIAPTMPDWVTDLKETFSDCSSLKEVPAFPRSLQSLSSTFARCSALTKVPEFPDTIINMNGAFSECTSLRSIPSIPDGVQNMGDTFEGCTSLRSIPSIPDSVRDMYGTFKDCNSLLTVPNIPSNVENLAFTFSGCSSLQSVPDIQSERVYRLDFTFSGCSSLTVAPKLPSVLQENKNDDEYEDSEDSDPTYEMYSTFSGCESLIETPVLPDNVQSLFDTFHGCTSLKKVVQFPSAIRSLETTFGECTSLTEVADIPASVTWMYATFWGCTSLEKAPAILGPVENMTYCFGNCSALRQAPKLPDGLINASVIYHGCSSLESSPELPESVKYLTGAFSECKSLRKVVNIPENAINVAYMYEQDPLIEGELDLVNEKLKGNDNRNDYIIASMNAEGVLNYAATSGKGVVLNYSTETEDLVDNLIANKTAGSKITKGKNVGTRVKKSQYLNKGCYSLSVVNSAGKPIKGVAVSYGQYAAGKTDQYGKLILDFTEKDLLGVEDIANATTEDYAKMHILKLTKYGYRTYEKEYSFTSLKPVVLYSTDEVGIESFTLKAGSKTYDLLKEKAYVDKAVNKENIYGILITDDTFRIQCKPATGEVADYDYYIVHGGKQWKGDESGVITIRNGDMIEGRTTTLLIGEKATKKIVYSEKVNVKVVDSAKLMPSSFKIGGDLSITVPESVPFLGGQQLKFKPIEFKNAFNVEVSQDKIKIGVNLDLSKSEDYGIFRNGVVTRLPKKSMENLDNLLTRNEKTWTERGALSIKIGFGGVFEGALEDFLNRTSLTTLDGLQGTLFVKVTVSYSTEKQIFVFGVPALVVAADASGSLKGSIEVSSAKSDGYLEPEVSLNIFGGVGLAHIASAGIYGEGTLGTKLLVYSSEHKGEGLKEGYIKGNAGVMLRYHGKEGIRIPLIGSKKDDIFYFYKESDSTSKKAARRVQAVSDSPMSWEEQIESALTNALSGMNDAAEIDRTYLDDRTDWMQEKDETSAEDVQVLQSSTYPDIQPIIAKAGTSKVMVWADDLGSSRDSANRTAVVYSILDEESGAWSQPIPVYDDGTADYDPAIVASEGKVYVTWVDAKEKLNSDEALSQQSIGYEISAACILADTGEVEYLGRLTDNEIPDLNPGIAASDGTVTVYWTTNSEGDPFGLNGKNNLQSAVWKGGNWDVQQEQELTGVFLDQCSVVLGGKAYRAVYEDTDRDLATGEDRGLYLIGSGGTKKLITEDITGNLQTVRTDMEEQLVWTSGNKLYALKGNDGAPKLIAEGGKIGEGLTYVYGDREGNLAVLSLPVADGQTQVWLQEYDAITNTWSEAVRADLTQNYVERPAGFFENGILHLSYSDIRVAEDGTLLKTDFCSAQISGKPEVAITEVSCDETDLSFPGTARVSVHIQNKGIKSSEELSVKIVDENGVVVAQQTAASSLKPAEEQIVELDVPFAGTQGAQDFIASVGDSTQQFVIGDTDLYLDAEIEEYRERECITFSVTNTGWQSASAKLQIYDYYDASTIWAEEDIPELENGDVFTYSVSREDLDVRKEGVVIVGARVTYKTHSGETVETENMGVLSDKLCHITIHYLEDDRIEEMDLQKGVVPELASYVDWYIDEDCAIRWDTNTSIAGDMDLYTDEHVHVLEFLRKVEPTCEDWGYTIYICRLCEEEDWPEWEKDYVEPLGHQWGPWTVVKSATSSSTGLERRTCRVCGDIQEREISQLTGKGAQPSDAGSGKASVSPLLRMNAVSLKMSFKQKNAKLKALLLPGDRIVSAVSSNEKIVKASIAGVENVKLVAKKKKGKATVTIRTALGQSATVSVQVQKKKVKTSGIGLEVVSPLTLHKGESISLGAEMLPITSQDKLTFKTSSKKIVSVSKKGVVKAKKPGKATITVKAGKKKKKVKIVVVP